MKRSIRSLAPSSSSSSTHTIFLSKKSYNEIKGILLKSFDEDDASIMLHAMCKVLKFDHDQGLYSKEKLKKISEVNFAKAAERGISTYELRNQRAYYDKNKERLNKQRLAYYHKKKAEAAAAAAAAATEATGALNSSLHLDIR